jgi:hypothetical protein
MITCLKGREGNDFYMGTLYNIKNWNSTNRKMRRMDIGLVCCCKKMKEPRDYHPKLYTLECWKEFRKQQMLKKSYL